MNKSTWEELKLALCFDLNVDLNFPTSFLSSCNTKTHLTTLNWQTDFMCNWNLYYGYMCTQPIEMSFRARVSISICYDEMMEQKILWLYLQGCPGVHTYTHTKQDLALPTHAWEFYHHHRHHRLNPCSNWSPAIWYQRRYTGLPTVHCDNIQYLSGSKYFCISLDRKTSCYVKKRQLNHESLVKTEVCFWRLCSCVHWGILFFT